MKNRFFNKKSWGKRVLLALFLFFLFSKTILAFPGALELVEKKDQYNIYSYLQVLEDPEGNLDLEGVLSPGLQEQFQPHGNRTPSYSYTDSAYWFRWEITDLTSQQHWFLEVEYPLLHDVRFFFPTETGEYEMKKAGSLLPFDQRPLENRNFVFPLPEIPPGKTITLYLRTETEFAHIVPLTIWEQNSFYSRSSLEHLFQGAYLGMLLIVALYTLFIFFFSRDMRFLFYTMYILCIAFFHLSLNGLSFQFFWPQAPDWANRSVMFFSFGGNIFLLLFATKILNLKKNFPGLNTFFLGIAGFSLLMLPFSLFLPYTLAMQLNIATIFAGSVTLIAGVYRTWEKKYRPAVFLFWAWVFLVGGIFLLMGRSFGILPHGFLTFSGIQIGSALEIVFLSLSLVAHSNFLKKEKEQAQELARRDDLTGLFNRRALFSIGQKQVEIARLQNYCLSVVMVDIDNFKEVNDNFGHEAGDNVLRVFAEKLRHKVRATDCVARYGGDEFCILLPLTNSGEAQERIEELREDLGQDGVFREGDYDFQLTASFGISALQGEKTFQELISRADSALYTAKKEGGNRAVILSREL